MKTSCDIYIYILQVADAKTGEMVRIETADWTGGQIGNNDSADDMRNIDLTKVHNLSGPISISDQVLLPCSVAVLSDIPSKHIATSSSEATTQAV